MHTLKLPPMAFASPPRVGRLLPSPAPHCHGFAPTLSTAFGLPSGLQWFVIDYLLFTTTLMLPFARRILGRRRSSFACASLRVGRRALDPPRSLVSGPQDLAQPMRPDGGHGGRCGAEERPAAHGILGTSRLSAPRWASLAST